MRSLIGMRGVVVLLGLVLSGSAFAQGSPRTMDPGPSSGPETCGNNTSWSLVAIPGLESGSTLGALTVNSAGLVYVWAVRTEPAASASGLSRTAPTMLGADPRHTGPGDLPPTEPGQGGDPLMVTISTLYQFSNGEWHPFLQLRGERGVSVFAAKSGELFASTRLADGGTRVYHKSRGAPWRNEALPLGVNGAGAFAGTERIFFRAGDYILARHGDNDWRVEVYSKNLASSGELVSIQDDEMMAPCDNGQFLWNGFDWSWHPTANETHVHGAWGGRDITGALHLFATGCNRTQDAPLLWQFVEDVPGRLNGSFEPLDLLPPIHHSPPSYGSEVWGSRVHDVYVTGCCDQCGRLLHFNGQAWSRIIPMLDMPPAVGVSGTAAGEVWVSLADGRLLHLAATTTGVGSGSGPGAPEADPLPVLKRPGFQLAVRDGGAGQVDLAFSVPSAGPVRVAVFDLAGRLVQTLARDQVSAGDHRLSWDAKGVPSGIYFCRMEAGQAQVTRRILVHH